MTKLFAYRRVFHSIAARATSPGTSTAIAFCWVDVILVKLSDAIITLSSRYVGDVADLPCNHKLASLKRQKEEAAITAATQLPRARSLSQALCIGIDIDYIQTNGRPYTIA